MFVDFEKQVTVTDKEAAKLAAPMANWKAAYAAMKSLPDSAKSLDTISKMIAWEINNPNGARSQLLERMHMRFNAMRSRMEYAKLKRVVERQK